MKLKFWQREEVSGECTHLWSNWTDPAAIAVTTFSMFSSGTTAREGWAQDRHCLKCNVYERKLA